MQKETKRGKIKSVAERWRDQYTNSCHDTYESLKALDKEIATEEEVANIIGNNSWTAIECHECGKDVDSAVWLGEDLDYESQTACVCEDCLKKAMKLFS